MRSDVRYADSDGTRIAYQIVGDGTRDLVLVHGWVTHLELLWEYPPAAHAVERLASFARVIHFDKRGTGLSDPVPIDHLPTLEQRMDDVRAVMDAVGSQHATLLGHSEGGPMCALFAATFPERTDQLIIYGSYAARIPDDDDYPWAPTPEVRERYYETLRREWGGPVDIDMLAPSRAHDTRLRAWWARYLRSAASPSAVVALTRMNTQADIRSILPTISVPTLILHRKGDLDVDIGGARYLASHIPGAHLVELPGDDHLIWSDPDQILDPVEEFVTGAIASPPVDRVLTTVLFTDIVGSTGHATALGDARWRQLLDHHDTLVRRLVARHRGREMSTAGDSFMVTFDGPARAILCALEIAGAVSELGLEVRCGVHTGEVTLRGDGIGGVAVHTASRIMHAAAPGEVLASRTVRDLVAGSGLSFADRGTHRFKGLKEPIALAAASAE
ncbi:MAG TPA: adenylate/guanylate cyclase domain-containing protein [Euzebyales bacterium]